MQWRFDPVVVASSAAGIGGYLYVAGAFGRRRNRPWPRTRSAFFCFGVLSAWLAIESPLDAAGDTRFAPHMIAHLIVTDVSAPFVLLGAPLALLLGAAPRRSARTIVAALRTPLAHALTFPVFTWSAFVVTLWLVHFSTFFEAALDNQSLHQLEHALFLATGVLFWLPVIAAPGMPWMGGALAYPLRLLYLLLAMPAEAFLGLAIYSSRHLLYAHYARAGLSDQQTAGEIMWIGSGLIMFVAFMAVGFEWAIVEQRADAKRSARDARAASAPTPQR